MRKFLLVWGDKYVQIIKMCYATGFLSYALIFVFLIPVNSYSQEILSKTSSCNFTIGDFVWNDTNGNGIQDAGEPAFQMFRLYYLEEMEQN